MNPKIHVTRWGSVGPKIILVHGSAQGSSVGGDRHFARQHELTGFEILVPDRPGHGQSPALDRGDDATEDGKWIADLLGDGAHLVGHSFGGACALNAVSRRPSAVRSLTLIEPAMFALATSDARVRRFLTRYLLTRIFSFSKVSRAQAFAKLMHIPPEIGGARSPEELRKMADGLARLKLPAKRDLEDQLIAVREKKIPLLLVTGGWNPAFTAVGEMVAQQGGGQHRIIECPHHFPHLISNEFNEILAKLASV